MESLSLKWSSRRKRHNISRQKVINFSQVAAEFSLWMVIFFIPISIALTNIGIGFAVFFWLLKKVISRNWRLIGSPASIGLILLALFSLLSLFNTISMWSSLVGLVKLAKGAALFFVVAETVSDRKKFNRLLWAALLGLGLVSLDGIFQHYTGADFIHGYGMGKGLQYLGHFASPRITASMKNANDISVYLITLSPILFSLVLFYLKGLKRLVLVLAALAALFCMFFTFQRIIGVAFVIIMVLFLVIKKDIKPVIILLLFCIISVYALPKVILQWQVQHLSPYDFFIEVGGRRWHWQAAMNMIKAHPFIGVGVNTFSINYDTYKIASDPIIGWYAHNAYLQLAAEIGIFGLGVFLWMIAAVTGNWYRMYKKLVDSGSQAVSLGVFGGFLGYLVSGMLESNLQYSNLAVLFWFILGLTVATSKIGGIKIK